LVIIDVVWQTQGMPRPLPLIEPVPTAVSCCAPLASAPLDAPDSVELANRLKALADPARLQALSILLASENNEACTCDLTEPLGLAQPTVTHHLRKLLDAGLVTAQRRGVWTFYRADTEALAALASVLSPAGALARS
jgi:ArsR family transcriptional regulator, arsenate/arsenite/antimonite-responsive transcriptional repressor